MGVSDEFRFLLFVFVACFLVFLHLRLQLIEFLLCLNRLLNLFGMFLKVFRTYTQIGGNVFQIVLVLPCILVECLQFLCLLTYAVSNLLLLPFNLLQCVQTLLVLGNYLIGNLVAQVLLLVGGDNKTYEGGESGDDCQYPTDEWYAHNGGRDRLQSTDQCPRGRGCHTLSCGKCASGGSCSNGGDSIAPLGGNKTA